MKQLDLTASDRDTITSRLQTEFADLLPAGDRHASPTAGGQSTAHAALAHVDAKAYGRSRNFYEGAVTRLSPWIRHGVVTLEEVRQQALAHATPKQAEKLIQELTWREFWQRIWRQHPEWLWQDVEEYKTGFVAADYADELPVDIIEGKTGVACIDHFIGDLLDTGYMHNHTRMYVAAYVVHFRNIKWQAGARWFLTHLIDGDPASNNFSWQWIASTFSHKPYLFNLENVAKYCGDSVDCSPEHNAVLDTSYEELTARLFPGKLS